VTEPVLLAFEDREYTRSELDALTSGMAAVLEQRGVRAGDRVALMSSNRPEFVVAMRAIGVLGRPSCCSARRGNAPRSSTRWR